MKQILFVLFVVLISCQIQAQEIDLDSLLIQSVGDKMAFSRIKTIQTICLEGDLILNNIPGSFQLLTVMPDKIYMTMQMDQFEMTQIYNGNVCWQIDMNGSFSDLSGYEKDALISQAYMQTYSYLFDDRISGGKEYLGKTFYNDNEYHLVAFYPQYKDTLYSLIDIESGLPRVTIDSLDRLETIVTIDDYRTIEDVAVSFHSLSRATGAPITSEFSITKVEFDSPITMSLFEKSGSQNSDFLFPDDTDSIVVPFEMGQGHIYLSVIINGSKKVRMILDTGASSSVLYPSVFSEMSFDIVGKLPASGLGGYEEVDLVKIDSLIVDRLKLYDQIAGFFDIGFIESSNDDILLGGILGYDFLSRFPIMIDYGNRQVVVYNPDTFVFPIDGSVVPFRLISQVPTIEATLVGIKGDFLIDLGNSAGLLINNEFAKINNMENYLDDIRTQPRGLYGVGGIVNVRSAYAAEFAFGDVRINSIRVLLMEEGEGLANSGSIAGNIGSLVLQQFKILFDYASSQVGFYEIQAGGK